MNRYKSVLATLVFLVLATTAVLAQSNSGETTFTANCTMCHGADGSGNTPAGKHFGAYDLRGAHVKSLTDAQIEQVITDGRKAMPAYGKNLSAEQIKGLVQYIRQLQK
ncbi:MAG: c-type cytochrome [Acidobacteriaceae bacterium]